jgi:nitrogen fixation protein FixH
MSIEQLPKFFSQENKKAFRNPWVIGWLTLLIVVFGVNAGMVTIAVVTNPGLVEQDYYERGRDHERNFLQRMEARTKLGWSVGLSVPTKAQLAIPGLYSFSITDRDGVPVRGAEVVMEAYRPSDVSADFSTVLAEVAPGRYDAAVSFPLQGIWDITVNVTHGSDRYDIKRRIAILPR